MKNLIMCFMIVCFTPIFTQAQRMDLEYLRDNYYKSVTDKQLCSNLISTLEKEKDNSVYLAYLGGFQTIWANHTMNPISKLKTFNRGKKNLEKAVEMASDNIEIRFLRLSVQKNAPTFLGYHQHIETDEAFINNHLQDITSTSLLYLINKNK